MEAFEGRLISYYACPGMMRPSSSGCGGGSDLTHATIHAQLGSRNEAGLIA